MNKCLAHDIAIYFLFSRSKFPNFHKTISTNDWNVEQGYLTAHADVYPKRALRIGGKHSLMIVLNLSNSDIEYDCALDESGYRVSVFIDKF